MPVQTKTKQRPVHVWGPGLRWGVMGPSLQWHVGGGAGRSVEQLAKDELLGLLRLRQGHR